MSAPLLHPVIETMPNWYPAIEILPNQSSATLKIASCCGQNIQPMTLNDDEGEVDDSHNLY